MASRTSLRQGTLDAYRSLSEGDVLPLVALLDPEVEWIERTATDQSQSWAGSAAVAALLRERVGQGQTVELHGVAVENDTLILTFDRPWWEGRRRSLRTFLVRGLGGTFTQTVMFGRLIERIESSWTFVGPRQGDELESFDAFAVLLHR